MNLLFVIVDSLRWDYAEKCGLFDAMSPCDVFKCKVYGETTSISLPQILSGIVGARSTVIGSKLTRNGKMWLTRIDEPTIFDYFRQKGYFTQYINVDEEDSLWHTDKLSFFPNLPSGLTLNEAIHFSPYCIVLHLWDVHYPYPEGYENRVRDFIENRISLLKSLRDTVVVMTADHGESLGENGRWGHSPPMTKELQEVPLIIYPSEEHRKHNRAVESIHILPTILDMFGIDHKLKGSLLG